MAASTSAARAARAGRVRRRQAAAEQKAVFDQLQSSFGITDAILDADPTDPTTGFTLREAFDQIRREKITDANRAAEIINRTTWFKAHGPGILERIALKGSNYGVWKQNVRDKSNELRHTFVAQGLNTSQRDLYAMAVDAYEYGLSAQQVVDKYLSKIKVQDNSSSEQDLRQFAQSMGVKMTDDWYRKAAVQVATNQQNKSMYEDTIKTLAKDTYSYWSDKIDQGQSVEALASQYIAYAQQWLENPSIGLNDVTIRKALQPADGSGSPVPLWQFEKQVKQDPRWLQTSNARQKFTDTAANLLRSWGKA